MKITKNNIDELFKAGEILEQELEKAGQCQEETCGINIFYKDFNDDELNGAIKIMSRNFPIILQSRESEILFEHLLWERKARKTDSEFFTENQVIGGE